MRRHRFVGRDALVAAAVAFASGCAPFPSETRTGESLEPEAGAFAALQARGGQAMGNNRYISAHRFDPLADGGRIELQLDVDSAGVEQVRRHLGRIAKAFASRDFSTRAFAHLREMPGTAVMVEKKNRVEYVYRELPRGAELRLATTDPDALRAIHEFIAFLRQHHHASKPEGGTIDHAAMHHRKMGHGKMDHATIQHGAKDHGVMHYGAHGGHTRDRDTSQAP